MNKNRAVILAKIESTYGVDAAPSAATNAIFCSEPEIEVQTKKIERANVRSTYGAQLPINIGEGVKITFACEARGSGTAGTAPEIGPLLRACGLTETINAGVDVQYDPHSDGLGGESVTIWFYRHNLLHKVVGCRGTVKLEAKANEVGKFTFEFTGLYANPVDDTLPTATYNQTLPPVFQSASLSFDSYAAVVESLSIDLGNSISRRPDANAASGILEYFIGDRQVKGEIDPEAVALTTKDFWTMWRSSSAVAFTATIGQTAGNKLTVSGPKVAIDELKYGDRENILTYSMPLIFTPNAGDDEIKFTFA